MIISTTLPSLKPPLHLNHTQIHPLNKFSKQTIERNFTCRADLSQDAPLAVAIGSCILNSLVFPINTAPGEDDDGDSVIDSTDARLAVMGIISFIPYFNWLSWIFAWLDTGKQRYAVYALVYLAPYVRYNLSLSPEESWLPITSILLCIIHIQLETSIKNGDLQGFQIFKKVEKNLPRNTDIIISKEERRKRDKNLTSGEEHSDNEIGGWGVQRKPQEDLQHLKSKEDEENELTLAPPGTDDGTQNPNRYGTSTSVTAFTPTKHRYQHKAQTNSSTKQTLSRSDIYDVRASGLLE